MQGASPLHECFCDGATLHTREQGSPATPLVYGGPSVWQCSPTGSILYVDLYVNSILYAELYAA